MEFIWTKGAVKKEIDIKLRRGVAIKGKVTEVGSHRPVGGASIHFFQTSGNGRLEKLPDVASKEDGTFQAALPPGEGHALVLGPTLDYIPKETSGGMLSGSGRPGGRRTYAHDIITYQVKTGDAPMSLSRHFSQGGQSRAT